VRNPCRSLNLDATQSKRYQRKRTWAEAPLKTIRIDTMTVFCVNSVTTTENGGPTVAPRRSLVSRIRASPGYDTVARHLGCGWFGLLASLETLRVFAHLKTIGITGFAPLDWAGLLVCICLALIYLAFSWAILHRAPPVARTEGILPSLTAFAGTYLPWSFVLFASDQDPSGQNSISVVFLLIGSVAAVVVIFYLAKSFSIVPQAHRLIREGPYSLVRNPLYLAEEVALLGFLLRFYSPMTLALFLAHGALQIGRMLFEENLLRQSFTDYDDYARSTPRLIPFVW
jgi:protein-S-isoprenylcysteine O-methyltransferase Ste14